MTEIAVSDLNTKRRAEARHCAAIIDTSNHGSCHDSTCPFKTAHTRLAVKYDDKYLKPKLVSSST